jgi:hypothetical protein
MKKLMVLAIATALSLLSLSDEWLPYDEQIVAPPATPNETVDVDAIITETVKVIHEEGWTAADVADAIRSLRGLYLRDNATTAGRMRWHGKVVTTSVDTNTLMRTTIHEDGETFQDPAKVTTPLDAVRAANAKLPKPVMTNGIPARLAAARLRQRENATTTNEVTVTVKAGQN